MNLFLLSILTLIRTGKGRMVPCYVITYSNNPETKLHHVIKLDQLKCFPCFTSWQKSKCALTGLPHCSFKALITMFERQNLNQSVFWQINKLLFSIITKTFDLDRKTPMSFTCFVFFELGKMLATFHWERGRLPEAQTV